MVLCENYLLPDVWKDALLNVLLCELGVISVALLPSPILTLLPLGLSSGIVVDVGSCETRVMPVLHGVHIIAGFQLAALGAATLRSELRTNVPMGEDTTAADDLVQRVCMVKTDAATDTADVAYRLGDGQVVRLSAEGRSAAWEAVLGDGGDEDDNTVGSLVLDALLRCPVDAQAPLAANIVLAGGLVHAPGFRARLAEQLQRLRAHHAKYEALRNLKLSLVQAPYQCLAWRGAALFASLDLLPPASITRADYDKDVFPNVWWSPTS